MGCEDRPAAMRLMSTPRLRDGGVPAGAGQHGSLKISLSVHCCLLILLSFRSISWRFIAPILSLRRSAPRASAMAVALTCAPSSGAMVEDELMYRTASRGDKHMLRRLHEDWFPIRYNEVHEAASSLANEPFLALCAALEIAFPARCTLLTRRTPPLCRRISTRDLSEGATTGDLSVTSWRPTKRYDA
eukprot:scaffold657_cov245-Pinguiococcus_pyrenoidosus.AAC.11